MARRDVLSDVDSGMGADDIDDREEKRLHLVDALGSGIVDAQRHELVLTWREMSAPFFAESKQLCGLGAPRAV